MSSTQPLSYGNKMNYILKICNIVTKYPSHPNITAYTNNLRQWIDNMFATKHKNNNYRSRFIVDMNEKCENKEVINYIVQKIYENMLFLQNQFITHVYSAPTPLTPFVSIFIDAHGKDLDEPIANGANILAYNWSPGPGIITINMDDDNTAYVLDSFQSALIYQPPTFTELINSIGCNIKSKYLEQLGEIEDSFYTNDSTNMLVNKYKKYSCAVIKPVKNKLYNFNKLLCPGIYVLALVNLPIKQENMRLLNLLIYDDMVLLNRLFNKPDDYGMTIFKNQTVENLGVPDIILHDYDITINDIYEYFHELGIENIGIVDLSCRYSKNVCELNTKKQMVIEELGSYYGFRTFGGSKRKQKARSKRKQKTRSKRK